ncbi:MAG: 3-methyl-2-oxobutanoate hydroxymethyltransferase [Chloroflexota bacterium]
MDSPVQGVLPEKQDAAHGGHQRPKVTVNTLGRMAARGERIAMVTAYDYPSARLADAAGVDIVLVGDTLAMTVLGYATTLPVTMTEMLIFTAAAARGCRGAFIVGDMPYLSYTVTPEEAVRNAGRFLQEAGADGVKMEGGRALAPTVRRVVEAGIPVMGHVGLMPQSLGRFGGYKVQGRTAPAAQSILEDALAIEAAGAFALVVEAVPAEVGQVLAERLSVPVIGIGAGGGCDGQVLVWHDLLGLTDDFMPRYLKRYAALSGHIVDALRAYVADVRGGLFPAEEHTYHLSGEEAEAFHAI